MKPSPKQRQVLGYLARHNAYVERFMPGTWLTVPGAHRIKASTLGVLVSRGWIERAPEPTEAGIGIDLVERYVITDDGRQAIDG